MTNVLDPAAETRVIPYQADQTAAIRRVGEQTVLMRTDLGTAAFSPLPRYETARHAALPARCGVVLPDTTLDLRPPLPGDPPPLPPTPTPPPVPMPGPAWSAPGGWYPSVPAPDERVARPDDTAVLALRRRSVPYVKPEGYVRTVRRAAPTPLWSLLLAGLGAGLSGGVLVLALAWVVAQ